MYDFPLFTIGQRETQPRKDRERDVVKLIFENRSKRAVGIQNREGLWVCLDGKRENCVMTVKPTAAGFELVSIIDGMPVELAYCDKKGREEHCQPYRKNAKGGVDEARGLVVRHSMFAGPAVKESFSMKNHCARFSTDIEAARAYLADPPSEVIAFRENPQRNKGDGIAR